MRGVTKKRRWLAASFSILVLAAVWIAWLNARTTPLRVDPLLRKCGEAAVDEDLELALRFAPWIYHEIHATGGRQDIPAPVDFDGNQNGDDNWDAFPSCELVPTLSYAHVETATHHFLTYHVFHPRDWEPIDLGVHMTHEGDGENMAVVVDKAEQRVVLLFTQAHYRGGVYANDDSGFTSGTERIRGPLLRIDEDGRPDEHGTHAAIFIESRGHGIYGALDRNSRVRIDREGHALFERHGLVLRPAGAEEFVHEPSLDSVASVPYQLESTLAKLWPLLLRGELAGPGRLLDGTMHYEDSRVSLELPKFHRGDRFSGPFGTSRGISPFAVDFKWSAGTLGALFFDPARRYAQCLSVPEHWSLEYLATPWKSR